MNLRLKCKSLFSHLRGALVAHGNDFVYGAFRDFLGGKATIVGDEDIYLSDIAKSSLSIHCTGTLS